MNMYEHPAIDAVIDGMEAAESVSSNPADSAPIHGAVSFLATLESAGYEVVPASRPVPDREETPT